MKDFRQTRRQLLGGIGAGSAALALGGVPAFAQEEKFPSKPIQVVIHAGPGGGTDITTRLATVYAQKVFGVEMPVVYKGGGQGAAALLYAASQPRDGYTILTITQSHIFTILQRKVPLTIDDIVGIARATDDPVIVTVRADSPIRSLDDLVKASKEREEQGGLKWGTTFVGGADHVAIHRFSKALGIRYTIVPFKGGGAIVTSLVGGDLDLALLNYAEGEAQYRAGALRPVVALSRNRIPALPDTPTALELGVDVVASTVRGFACLRGMPEDRIEILEKGLLECMSQPIYHSYLRDGGMAPDSVVGRAEWTAQIRRIHDESRETLEELGLL